MGNFIRKIILVLLAGALGGLANSLGIWFTGNSGINHMLGFRFQPELTMPWLMPRLVSSALWGLLFLLPFWRTLYIQKGMLLSLGPLAMMLFVVFPKMQAGMFGLGLGMSAPIFALAFTMVWGMVAGLFLKLVAFDRL